MIYIDVSAAVHSRAGLGRYSERLAQALWTTQPDRFHLFFNQGQAGKLPASLASIPNRHIQWGYKPWRMAVLLSHWAHMSLNHLVPNAQLFHSTEHLLMPLRGIPTILTVHDLIFKLFPAYHKKLNYWYLNLAVPLFCRQASAIIAVSQASKRDIVQHYGVDPAKIHVVYEAAAEHFQPPTIKMKEYVRTKFGLPANYLVHLSTIEPRKNLLRVLEALKIWRQDFPDLHLVLVGAKGWLYDDFFAKVEAEGLTNVVHALGWVEDDELPAVIANATLAIQPSLYEGFGLPILEHMACGQVVAASNTSSHPEVGGEAAAYFDPHQVEDMVQTVSRLLHHPAEREHRQQLGLTQAQQFSWTKTAQQTLKIYNQLLT